MRSLWRRLTNRSTEEIAPWVGLAFGVLYLCAVAGVGAAALHFQRAGVEDQRLQDARQWTFWLARHLANVQAAGDDALRHEIRKAAREPGVTFSAIVARDGKILIHSDPDQAGRMTEPVAYTDPESARVQAGTSRAHEDQVILTARILSPSGGATDNELWIGLGPSPFVWTQSEIVFCAGYILLGVLGLFLLVYRSLRRSVQPLAVIRNRLVGCAEPVPERLVALRLNDSYDQISTSWNHLIEFVSDMHDQLSRTRLTTDVNAAMDGYRSERLTDLLMRIPFGIFVVDSAGNISFANRAANGMLAQPGEALDGQPASDFLEENLRVALLSPGVSRSGSLAGSRWTDHTFERPHNTVTLRFWSSPSDERGNEYVIFVQDVTQAKEAEQARDHFLYHVTHEFRTPLTNIRAYAETLSQGVIDDEQTIRECYNVIMGETSRLGRLVEDLLNISQLEVGTAKLSANPVHLADPLRKVVQDNQGGADAKNIDLVLSLPAKMPKVMGDRDRLTVVLNNLIGNAIKYTPEGGRVEVRCTPGDQRVEVAVADTGMGIAPADQEKIFDKFYRVDDERVAAIPGSGLGLAIARETVRAHGGKLTVESTPAKGTTFTMVLPALSTEDGGSGAGGPLNVSKKGTT